MKYLKFNLLFSFILLAAVTVQAQLTAKVYADENIEQIVSRHKVIAILPLKVDMRDTRSKKNRVSQEELDEKALEYQENFQSSMYAWFLKRKGKKKMIDVKIQDVDRTNALLKQNGIITSEDLDNYTKDEIANMLEVDAVFGGDVKTTVSFGDGGAIALSILTNVNVKTGNSEVFIKLWNAKDGDMIWSFAREVDSSYAKNTDETVNYLMKRISKRFPYEK